MPTSLILMDLASIEAESFEILFLCYFMNPCTHYLFLFLFLSEVNCMFGTAFEMTKSAL